MNVFVTGTDTGVGKTFFVVEILKHLRAQGLSAVGMKPICCGDRGDARALLDASADGVSMDEINPVWLRTPLAPAVAAELEQVEIGVERLAASYAALAARFDVVLVEGVGGWLVPLTRKRSMEDFAKLLELPVVIVAANRLGCMNHICLTAQAVRSAGLAVAAVAMNEGFGPADLSQSTNAAEVARLTSAPTHAWKTAADFGSEWASIFSLSASSEVSE